LKRTENITLYPYIDLLLRWILGLTFAIAGGYKLTAPETFAQILISYDLLPAAAIQPVVVFLPCLELVVGVALASGIYPRAAALLSNILLVVFMVAITLNLLRGQVFDCGCFPTVMKKLYASSPFGMLARDAILMLMGVGVMVYRGPRKWVLRRFAA